jgi:hypothetical protein
MARPPGFTWYIANRDHPSQPVQYGMLTDRISSELVLGINEVRQAKVTISLDHPAAVYFGDPPLPGDYPSACWFLNLVCLYGDTPIFAGPILNPYAQDPAGGGEATAVLEIGALGVEKFLDRRIYQQYVVATEDFTDLIYNVAWEGAEFPNGTTGLRMNAPGTGDSPMTGASLAYERRPGTSRLLLLQTLLQHVAAPEVEFATELGDAYDADPLTSDPLVPQLGKLKVHPGNWYPSGSSASQASFEYGYGRNNATGYYSTPAGEEMDNYIVGLGDTPDSFGVAPSYKVHNTATSENGRMRLETWLQAPNGYEPYAALEWAKWHVLPPDRFDFIPANPKGSAAYHDDAVQGVHAGPLFAPPEEDGDFWLGDVCTLTAKRGSYSKKHVGRVMQATLSEDEDGVITPNLECVQSTPFASPVSGTAGTQKTS